MSSRAAKPWAKHTHRPSGGSVSFGAADIPGGASKILVFGGQRHAAISDELWAYEPQADEPWLLLHHDPATKPPAPRTQAALAALPPSQPDAPAQMLLFAGYVQDVGEVGETWLLTVATNAPVKWELLPCVEGAPAARYGHSMTSVARGALVFGGQDGRRQFDDCWLFDAAGTRWSQVSVPSSPSPRTRHAAVALGEKLLIIGGYSRADGYLGDAHLLALAGDAGEWAPVSLDATASEAAWGPRAQHCAAASADSQHVVVFGGYNGTSVLNELWLLEMVGEGGSVQAMQLKVSGAPEPRSRCSCHILGGGELVVLGGYDGNKPHGGDAFHLDVSSFASLLLSASASEPTGESVETIP